MEAGAGVDNQFFRKETPSVLFLCEIIFLFLFYSNGCRDYASTLPVITRKQMCYVWLNKIVEMYDSPFPAVKYDAYILTPSTPPTMPQIDFIVPSSKSPHQREWSLHYWYFMFAAGLQADPSLTDEDADMLIHTFRGLQVTLCCQQCKVHYKTYFDKTPYTMREAKNRALSMQWIRDLRLSIQARVDADRAAAKTAVNEEESHAPMLQTCTSPLFPGKVYEKQACLTLQRRTDTDRLDRAIAAAISGDAGKTEPCDCTLQSQKYEVPKWGMSGRK